MLVVMGVETEVEGEMEMGSRFHGLGVIQARSGSDQVRAAG